MTTAGEGMAREGERTQRLPSDACRKSLTAMLQKRGVLVQSHVDYTWDAQVVQESPRLGGFGPLTTGDRLPPATNPHLG